MTQVVLEMQQALSTAGMDGAAKQAEGLLASSTAAPNQALPAVSTAGTSSSVDIIASESCMGPLLASLQTWPVCVSLQVHCCSHKLCKLYSNYLLLLEESCSWLAVH